MRQKVIGSRPVSHRVRHSRCLGLSKGLCQEPIFHVAVPEILLLVATLRPIGFLHSFLQDLYDGAGTFAAVDGSLQELVPVLDGIRSTRQKSFLLEHSRPQLHGEGRGVWWTVYVLGIHNDEYVTLLPGSPDMTVRSEQCATLLP